MSDLNLFLLGLGQTCTDWNLVNSNMVRLCLLGHGLLEHGQISTDWNLVEWNFVFGHLKGPVVLDCIPILIIRSFYR